MSVVWSLTLQPFLFLNPFAVHTHDQHRYRCEIYVSGLTFSERVHKMCCRRAATEPVSLSPCSSTQLRALNSSRHCQTINAHLRRAGIIIPRCSQSYPLTSFFLCFALSLFCVCCFPVFNSVHLCCRMKSV